MLRVDGMAHSCVASWKAVLRFALHLFHSFMHFNNAVCRWNGSQLCGFMEGCAALPALGAAATQLWQEELLKVGLLVLMWCLLMI